MSTRLCIKRALLAAGAVTVAAALLANDSPAAAGSTATFKAATFAELNKGEPQGTLVSSEGEVLLGYGVKSVGKVDAPMLWTSARGADGTVYFGSGDRGEILAVRDDKVRKVAALKSVLVTALTVGPGGQLIAGTMPDARILSVDPRSGKWKQLAKLPTAHVWSVLHDAKARRIYAASGSPGKVFAIPEGGGKPMVHFDPGEKHLLCLAADGGGGLLVGSSDKAILYRVSAAGRASAVHDFDGTEVRDAVRTATGSIYVAVNNFPQKTSGLPRYDKSTEGETGTPMSKAKAEKPKYRASELRPGAKSGKGALFRIDREGRVDELLALTSGYFTDLAVDARGQVWAAEGTEGKVFIARSDRTVLTAADVRERQVLALAVAAEPLYFGTGDAGAVYRVSAKAQAPAYISQVHDAKFPARWGSVRYRATAKLRLLSRSGNTAKPDKTWSDWQPGGAGARDQPTLHSPPARYLQLKAEWADRGATLRSYVVYYRPLNQRARVTEITTKRKLDKQKKRTPVIEISWKVENPDKDALVYHLYYRDEMGARWREIKSPEPITKTKFEWDTEAIPDDRYSIKVAASDEQANGPESTLQGIRVSAPVLVDNRKPSLVGFTVRYPWASGMVRDSFSRIKRIAFSLDGSPWRVVDARDGIYDSPTENFFFRLPTDLSRGVHILAIRAHDAAGNAGVSQVRFVR